METTAKVAVVYHSGFGHTGKQAAAVCDGIDEVGGARSRLITVELAVRHQKDLAAADAIVFGTPTYMGGPSAEFKKFQEQTRTVIRDGFGWRDKVAAGFTNSGALSGDKLATLTQLALFAAQHGMHWVNLGLMPGMNSSAGSNADLNRLGFWLGAAAQSNIDEGPDATPPESDLLTARHLGRRVAETTLRLVYGRVYFENGLNLIRSAR